MFIKKFIFFGDAFIHIGDIRPYDLRHKIEDGKFIKKHIPRIIFGKFDCSALKLKTLENCPSKIFGEFTCDSNFIANLNFFPKKITKSISLMDNKLTSLKGMIDCVKSFFNCSHNLLSTLEGGPKVVYGNYICSNNKLTSLKGSPHTLLNGHFDCSYNLLTDLKNAPLHVYSFDCNFNELSNLYGCPSILNFLTSYGNKSNLIIEQTFIESKRSIYFGHKIYDYWQELYNHIFAYNLNITDINWPDDIIESNIFNKQEKNILKSNKIISKFNL